MFADNIFLLQGALPPNPRACIELFRPAGGPKFMGLCPNPRQGLRPSDPAGRDSLPDPPLRGLPPLDPAFLFFHQVHGLRRYVVPYYLLITALQQNFIRDPQIIILTIRIFYIPDLIFPDFVSSGLVQYTTYHIIGLQKILHLELSALSKILPFELFCLMNYSAFRKFGLSKHSALQNIRPFKSSAFRNFGLSKFGLSSFGLSKFGLLNQYLI